MSTSDHNTDGDLRQLLASEPPRKKGRLLRNILIWGILLLVIILAAAKWFGKGNGEATEYITRDVQRGDLTVTVTATGNLFPTNQVDVGTEVSGTIESVNVDFNDVVKSGQVLARLDTTLLEAQVNQSGAAVESARANLLQTRAGLLDAQNEMDRLLQVRKLSDGKLPSAREFETAEVALERARANEAMAKAAVSQAEAKLKIDKTNLEKATIFSPINGVVLSRDIDVGQTVAASFQAPVLFTLAEDLTKMELHVNVDEADVGQVQEGQSATFSVDAYPDRTFPAAVTQVRFGSQTTEGVVTYLTVLNVDNSDLSLRPGMTATADMVVKQVDNALLVPNAALRYTPPRPSAQPVERAGGSLLSKLFPRPRHSGSRGKNGGKKDRKQQVWTLRDGKPVAIPVTAGATNGIMTEIIGGKLDAGMPLIIESVSKES